MTLKSAPRALSSRFLSLPVFALVLLAGGTGCVVPFGAHGARGADPRPAALAKGSARDPHPHLGAPEGEPRVLRARVYASPSYVAQTPDWKAHFAGVLADASETLEEAVGAEVSLEESGAWEVRPDARLEEQLQALRAKDAGEDVDLVVGLAGGLPVASASFDQLGMSETPGKHLVLRAPDVATELAAVEREYAHLPAEERVRLRRERIRHREVAIVLHEIGHALGALHEPGASSLMAPAYDRRMSGFGPLAVARMKATLAPPAPAAARQEAPRERTSTTSATLPAGPDGVRADDRAAWQRAWATAAGGDAEAAWTIARPLFDAYPDVYEVQDLRCKLALARLGAYDAVRAECEPLMKITLKGAKPK
jgi:hypothetical protein